MRGETIKINIYREEFLILTDLAINHLKVLKIHLYPLCN